MGGTYMAVPAYLCAAPAYLRTAPANLCAAPAYLCAALAYLLLSETKANSAQLELKIGLRFCMNVRRRKVCQRAVQFCVRHSVTKEVRTFTSILIGRQVTVFASMWIHGMRILISASENL